MIGIALLALVVIGVVVTWHRHLPQPQDSWSTLSTKGRAFTALGIPTGLVMAAIGGLLTYAGAWSEPEGFYEGLALSVGPILTLGGLGVAGLTAVRIVRLLTA